MKKTIIFGIFVLMFALFMTPACVYASQITDTGGGDASQVASTEESSNSDSKAEEINQQVDDIINLDYIPNVKAEDFFSKVNRKLSETMSFGQKAAAIILAILFIIDLIMLAISALGSRKDRVVPCAVGLLIIALAFVGDIYVMDILGAFANYMGS